MPRSFIPIPGIPRGENLAEGGGGCVFLVKKGGKKFVCKQIQTNRLNPRETLILQRYSNRNLIHAIAVYRTTTPPLITSILLPWCTMDLHRFIHKHMEEWLISETGFRMICSDLVKGFHYLKTNGIAHLDFKSGNALIDSNCLVLICDFGHAQIQPANQRQPTLPVSTLGTPSTMAPEVLRCFVENVRHRMNRTFDGYSSDKYSVGAVLYELATGSVPYENAVNMRDLNQMMDDLWTLFTDIIQPLNDFAYINPTYSNETNDLIRRFLSLNPTDRPHWQDLLRLGWIEEEYGTFSREKHILGLSLGTRLLKGAVRLFKKL